MPIQRRFDEIFTTKTRFETLNQVLKRLHRNKAELLLVLERPEVPLHTNDSERDIRDYVRKRKLSGGTCSDLGRRCRDTFASLKKTCRKLGVSFWEFLLDRVSATNRIPPLPSLIRHHRQDAYTAVNGQLHIGPCPELLRRYKFNVAWEAIIEMGVIARYPLGWWPSFSKCIEAPKDGE